MSFEKLQRERDEGRALIDAQGQRYDELEAKIKVSQVTGGLPVC